MKLAPLALAGVLTYAGLWALAVDTDTTPPEPTVPAPTIVYTPLPPSTTTAAPTTTVGPPPSTTTTPIALVGPDTPCQEWVDTAIMAGWPADRETIETLLSVIWRESRCLPGAIRRNATTGNPVDVGLTQINQIHRAWLADMGWTHADMTDPLANLTFARRLYEAREQAGKCGWDPWRLKCR